MKKLLIIYRSGVRVSVECEDPASLLKSLSSTKWDAKTGATVLVKDLDISIRIDQIDHMEILK